MSASRSRSRSRSGATGERGGGGARRSGERGPGAAEGRGRGGRPRPQAPPHPVSTGPASPPPPLRRSQRKSGPAPLEAPPQVGALPPPSPLTLSAPAPRAAITLRKIRAPAAEPSPPGAPPTVPGRKVTLLEKENSPLLQEGVPLNKGSCPLAAGPALEVTTTVLGPRTPNAMPKPELMDARDLEMSRKVRRSYSRLDDAGLGSGATSTPNYRRQSFFGFERLLSGEELENISLVVKESKSQAVAPTAEPWGPDSSLPGITMTKEKRRKRRAVPGILKSELDEWAAAMNAQFEAAEKFDLLVE